MAQRATGQALKPAPTTTHPVQENPVGDSLRMTIVSRAAPTTPRHSERSKESLRFSRSALTRRPAPASRAEALGRRTLREAATPNRTCRCRQLTSRTVCPKSRRVLRQALRVGFFATLRMTGFLLAPCLSTPVILSLRRIPRRSRSAGLSEPTPGTTLLCGHRLRRGLLDPAHKVRGYGMTGFCAHGADCPARCACSLRAVVLARSATFRGA
jgi:hypothetical protein